MKGNAGRECCCDEGGFRTGTITPSCKSCATSAGESCWRVDSEILLSPSAMTRDGATVPSMVRIGFVVLKELLFACELFVDDGPCGMVCDPRAKRGESGTE